MPDDGAHRLWTMRAGRLEITHVELWPLPTLWFDPLAVDVASTSSLG